MARNSALAGSLDTNGIVSAALGVLGALASSPTAAVSATDIARDLSLTDRQVDEVIDLLDLVSDSNTGARIALHRDGDMLEMDGAAGLFSTLRFTSDEVAALMHVLDRFQIAEGARSRILSALGPVSGGQTGDLLGGDLLFGGFYQQLCEAMLIGARIAISYQSLAEDEPSDRVVDPGFIMVAGDAAYLVAWNVEKDAQRSYRLDRISGVDMTEDSVEIHPFARTTAAESLRGVGSTATLRFTSRKLFDRCTWQGLHREDGRIQEDGSVIVEVSYTSPIWLFERILAAGGTIEIIEPESLRADLLAYARELQNKLT